MCEREFPELAGYKGARPAGAPKLSPVQAHTPHRASQLVSDASHDNYEGSFPHHIEARKKGNCGSWGAECLIIPCSVRPGSNQTLKTLLLLDSTPKFNRSLRVVASCEYCSCESDALSLTRHSALGGARAVAAGKREGAKAQRPSALLS